MVGCRCFACIMGRSFADISALLALPAEGVPLTPTELGSLTLATAVLQRLTGVNAAQATARLLPHRRAAHLRRVVYDALAKNLVDVCPWLLPPPLDATALKARVTVRFQYRLLLGWYEAMGSQLLTAPVLRHAWAVHCRLPLFPLPAHCQDVTLTSGTPCMQQISGVSFSGVGCGCPKPLVARKNQPNFRKTALRVGVEWKPLHVASYQIQGCPLRIALRSGFCMA